MSLPKVMILVMLASLLGFVSAAQGQFRDQLRGGDTEEYLRSGPQLELHRFRGLLDPSRMTMSHSVSMGYANLGGTSVTRGLYMNRLNYQISRPLSITTHLGYQFQPSGPAEWNPSNTGQDFVGGADLNWKPSRNSLLRLSVYRNMYPEYCYDPYGFGYWGSPYRSVFPGRR